MRSLTACTKKNRRKSNLKSVYLWVFAFLLTININYDIIISERRYLIKTIKKAVYLSGPLAFICYLLHDILGSINYPGYDPFTQAVSDLTAENAPYLWIARPLSALYGLFSIICVISACVFLRKKTNAAQYIGVIVFAMMNLISAVGYSLFPLTESGTPDGFQNKMHIAVTIAVVATSIISLLFIIVGGFLKKSDKAMAIAAAAAFLLMAGGAVGTNIAPASVFGIVERFSTYAAVGVTAFLGMKSFLIRENKGWDKYDNADP